MTWPGGYSKSHASTSVKIGSLGSAEVPHHRGITKEHLGQSDKAISAYRRILRSAIEQAGNGGTPLMVLDESAAEKLTGPAAIDGIGSTDGWQAYWRATDATRRKASSWASGR